MSKLNEQDKNTLSSLTQIEETYNFFKDKLSIAKTDYQEAKSEYFNKIIELDNIENELEDEDDIEKRLELRERIEQLREEARKAKQELEAKREVIEYLKGEIEENIVKIKSLPGMEQAIESVLERKYESKIRELTNEQKISINGKRRIEKLQNLLDEEKTDNAKEIKEVFRKMLDAKNHANVLNAKLKNIDGKLALKTISEEEKNNLTSEKINWNTKLEKALNEYKLAKDEFSKLSKNAKIEFEPAEIDALTEDINNSIERSHKRPNEYDLNKGIDKKLEKYSKEIKLFDDQKTIYENAKSGRTLNQHQQELSYKEPENYYYQEEKLHWWNPFHWGKMRERAKQRRLEAGKEGEREEQFTLTEKHEKPHEEFVNELQKSAIIDTIVTKEMREDNDRAADIRAQYNKQRQEEDRDDK